MLTSAPARIRPGAPRPKRTGETPKYLACPRPALTLLLASGNNLHRLQLLAIHGLEDVRDDPVVALNDDLVTARDLLAAQRAAFLRGALKLCGGGVAGEGVVGDRAAQATGPHAREPLLAVFIAPHVHAFQTPAC